MRPCLGRNGQPSKELLHWAQLKHSSVACQWRPSYVIWAWSTPRWTRSCLNVCFFLQKQDRFGNLWRIQMGDVDLPMCSPQASQYSAYRDSKHPQQYGRPSFMIYRWPPNMVSHSKQEKCFMCQWRPSASVHSSAKIIWGKKKNLRWNFFILNGLEKWAMAT